MERCGDGCSDTLARGVSNDLRNPAESRAVFTAAVIPGGFVLCQNRLAVPAGLPLEATNSRGQRACSVASCNRHNHRGGESFPKKPSALDFGDGSRKRWCVAAACKWCGRADELTYSSLGRCAWCECWIPTTARSDSRFCTKRCRQWAFRLRQRFDVAVRAETPLRFGYADPPYPGKARIYKNEATYAGEVDHAALIASLRTSYDGWALSTSSSSLRALLPLCPEGVRVGAWTKPGGVSRHTRGMHSLWEAVIIWPGRELQPGVRDWINAQPARRGGTLIGRKPLAFCAWLFRCLGMQPGDELTDLFPGTGIVSTAWRELCGEAFTASTSDASSGAEPFAPAPDDASLAADRHGSAQAFQSCSGDASRLEPVNASPNPPTLSALAWCPACAGYRAARLCRDWRCPACSGLMHEPWCTSGPHPGRLCPPSN